MATTAHSQFLFAANPDASQILGFEINADGGLSPVPGSPFEATDLPRLVTALGNDLLVAGKSTISRFVVNAETGAVSKVDVIGLPLISELAVDPSSGTAFATTAHGEVAIRLVNKRLQVATVSESGLAAEAATEHRAAMDRNGRFFYALDSGKGVVSAFQLQSGKPVPLSPSVYSVGQGAASIAIVGR